LTVKPRSQSPVLVVGAGSWGTALAVLLARNGSPTLLWGRDAALLARLSQERGNPVYLPGIPFPPLLEPETDLHRALDRVDEVLIAVASTGFRPVLNTISTLSTKRMKVAWATKGFEPASGKLLHEVVREEMPSVAAMAVISGPTFAQEVARGLPTAVTIACNDREFCAALQARFSNDRFRPYTSDDIVGVEIGGAVKNVLAIAAGIADGLGFGANTRAALVTRGLAEITRFGIAMGGRRETFMGLAGLGDLVLTCTDDQSRNRRFGLALGRGGTLTAAMREAGPVIEGMQTARELIAIARSRGIDMPISTEVHEVIYAGKDPLKAVETLFAREQKAEDDPR
jgi:glycerol-3-phosphate dehydrogenase (NAD(P)+)